MESTGEPAKTSLSRKRRLILVAAATCLSVTGVLLWLWPNEPGYEGKSLSEWIAPFCRQTATGFVAPGGPSYFEELQPVRQAVSQIGTNAVPYLIAQLDYRESNLHQSIRQLLDKQPLTALRLTDPRVVRVRAIRALAVLGTNAQPAAPSLGLHIRDTLIADHVVYALTAMGPAGMRELVNQYTNVGPGIRMQIAFALTSPQSTYRGENVPRVYANQFPVETQVEGLRLIIRHSLPGSVSPIMALQRLGALGSAASNAIPDLVPLLNDRNPITRRTTIRALGDIKAQPDVIIPILTNLLHNGDMMTQIDAAAALRAYGYNAQFRPNTPSVGMPHSSLSRPTNLFVPPTRIAPPAVPASPK